MYDRERTHARARIHLCVIHTNFAGVHTEATDEKYKSFLFFLLKQEKKNCRINSRNPNASICLFCFVYREPNGMAEKEMESATFSVQEVWHSNQVNMKTNSPL